MVEYSFRSARLFSPEEIVAHIERADIPVNDVTMTVLGDRVTIDFGTHILLSTDKEKLDRLFSQDHSVPMWAQTYWATVDTMNIPNKTIRVRRVWKGQEVTLICGVTWVMKQMFLAGELAIGDKVLVAFVDGDPQKPIVYDKIIL